VSREQKAPAMPMYTKDYDTDENVILMDLAQEGMYNRLLRHQWREGSIPADAPSLATICRVPLAKFQRVWTGRVADCFRPREGQPDRLVNPKLETVRTAQRAFHQERSESGRRGASRRHSQHTDDGSATGSANKQPLAPVQPAVAVAVAVPVTAAAAAPDNGHADRGLSKSFLSREERQRLIAQGEGYLDTLMARDPDQDRGWLLKQHSTVKGSGAYLARLDTGKDEHLTRTVHALRDAVEKLKAQDSGEHGGLLTVAEYERRRRG
jgi:uncharacterized protein YdaU (DUF1376 family)